MEKYMYMSLMLALACVSTLFLTACGDDDETPEKPRITLTEVGHDNSHHAHPGHDMHLEADIVAMGLIQQIDVEIHQEKGGSFEIRYTDTSEYKGKRNAEFHEHIDIPEEAPLGSYHLHFTVTDALGQSTTVEAPLEITEDDGDDDDEDEHDHNHQH